MHSIRVRITSLTVLAILISILSFGITGIYSVMLESNRSSAETLSLVCENRKNILDEYMNSIQQSVDMVSRYSTDSLDTIALVNGGVIGASGDSVKEIPGRTKEQSEQLDKYFDEYLAMIDGICQSLANHTNGIESYYYRINPELTSSAKGFFYCRAAGSGFQAKKLTPIESYTPEDVNHVGWYYIPLEKGRPIWTNPYFNANLGLRLVSYEVPIFKSGTFIGIIGMDIRYDTLVKQVEQLHGFKTGYFTVLDDEGRIFYHPKFQLGTDIQLFMPELFNDIGGLNQESSGSRLIRYMKDGKQWQLTYNTLSNGLKLVAVVEVSEINASATRLSNIFITAGTLILIIFIIITAFIMKRMTDPLKRLTDASRQLAAGDYDVELDYSRKDEIGVLTASFRHMRDHMKMHINDLNSLAYRDALTGVKNKSAYDESIANLNTAIKNSSENGESPEFAIILMDCDGLKTINDVYGHDKGDIYLRTSCRLICEVFDHSPVFRIGGDEFVVILQDADYRHRSSLMSEFDRRKKIINASATHPWNCAYISKGLAVYDPENDMIAEAVANRADTLMYEEKKINKEKNNQA